jgi:hypothetical protein
LANAEAAKASFAMADCGIRKIDIADPLAC